MKLILLIMNIGIIGASGLVGKQLIKLINNRNLDINYRNIKLFGSKNSISNIYKIKNINLVVQELNRNSFDKLDIAFFCATFVSIKQSK